MRRPALVKKIKSLARSFYVLFGLACVFVLLAFFAGVFSVPRSDLVNRVLYASLFAAMLILGLALFGWLYTRMIVNRIAPFVLNPYGVRDANHSRKLLNDFLFGAKQAKLVIEDGSISPKSDDTVLKTTLIGPGTIEVDWESAALVEKVSDKTRTFVLVHAGEHELEDKDRILGIVDLRPQKESFDFSTISTGDGILVRVRGYIIYHIEQDLAHLKMNRSHHTHLGAVKNAIMPDGGWQKRVIGAIEPIVRHSFREYELGEMFIREPRFAPSDTRAVLEGLAARRITPFVLGDVENRIKQGLQEVTAQWGVQISIVRIEEIGPPDELTDRAMRAYQVWLTREAELQRVETNTQIAQREAEAAREMAAIQRDTELIRSEAQAAALRSNASVEKDTALIRAEMQAETKRIMAEAEQRAQLLLAEAESDAHRLRMNAIGEAGMDVARRIDLLMDVTGRNLDDSVLREFLRAIGLLKSDVEGLDDQTSRVIQIRDIAVGGKADAEASK